MAQNGHSWLLPSLLHCKIFFRVSLYVLLTLILLYYLCNFIRVITIIVNVIMYALFYVCLCHDFIFVHEDEYSLMPDYTIKYIQCTISIC